MRAKPVYLNFFTIKFPVTAIVSILHRVSGILLFFIIPFFLSQLDTLLYYPARFTHIRDMVLNRPEKKIIILLGLIFFAYHFFAGIRHLIMDVGFGESRLAATVSSYVVFAFTLSAAIIMGFAVW